MSIEDIVEGGVYRGGFGKRSVIRKVSRVDGTFLYTNKGMAGEGTGECFYVDWFADWAKERIA